MLKGTFVKHSFGHLKAVDLILTISNKHKNQNVIIFWSLHFSKILAPCAVHAVHWKRVLEWQKPHFNLKYKSNELCYYHHQPAWIDKQRCSCLQSSIYEQKKNMGIATVPCVMNQSDLDELEANSKRLQLQTTAGDNWETSSSAWNEVEQEEEKAE